MISRLFPIDHLPKVLYNPQAGIKDKLNILILK